MTELDKLEAYLKEKNIPYRRHIHPCGKGEGIWCDGWDAVCMPYSYGYDAGLLEIYGVIVNEDIDHDNVVGFQTAEDVIERLEALEG